MARIVPIAVGDVVKLKKTHPCGSNAWVVYRVGMDVGLKCGGCGRAVLLSRSEFDRRFRGYLSRGGDAPEAPDGVPGDTEDGS